MVRRGKHLVRPLLVGQSATLRVPGVDRGPSDPRNMLVVVLKEQDGLYTVGCRGGILRTKLTAADLSAINQVLLTPDEVPDTTISLRTATAKATGGQGFMKCACKPQCTSGRCSCHKKKMICNSRCHPGRTCNNFWFIYTLWFIYIFMIHYIFMIYYVVFYPVYSILLE